MDTLRRWGLTLAGATLVAAAPLCGQAAATPPQGPAGDRSAAAANAAPGDTKGPPQWSLLKNRCEKCHNSEDWAGGVAFDTMLPTEIPSDAETWEKAVRKLRGRLMPPPGQTQPDQPTIDGFVTWMEGELDHAAASRTAPGNVGVHRLNRTEYGREIHALLGLDVDVRTLLPKDVSSDGFDNIAAVLRISPAFLDQYITAARNISRQAIGRVTAKPSSREYRVPSSQDQSEHIDGLPLGTRGGMLVEHYFPADGEYEFNIREFFFGGAGYVTKIDAAHHVILTLDDNRVFDGVFGGQEDLKAVDQHQATAADEMQSRFNHIRVKVKAGAHRVGVSFIQRSFAESDSPLQPIAELPEMERVPNIPGVDISGPFNVTGLSDTQSRRRIFICRPASPSEETACAQRILSHLAEQAFRRPVTDADVPALMTFYASGRQNGGDFEAGIESGLTAILSSTKFLFRAEPVPPQATPGSVVPVDPVSLASRLSFLLWSEGPDKPLIDLAASARLSDREVLNAQVHRMLADPRSQSLVTNFAFQWLNVSRMDTTEPAPVLYPEFDRNLREGYREEIRLFLDSILRANRSVLDLLSSDETFINERVARTYGIANIRGDQFRPVRLTDPNRWGLLGKGALLMATSYGNRTSPVLRGAWILDTLVGTPPESPPPGVNTTLNEAEPGKQVQTVRERMELHRQNPSCNTCHGVIDPLGFGLENFDVVGAWRERDLDAGTRIDSSGKLSNGTLIGSPSELRAALLARPDQFVQTVTEKLMTFALGRGTQYTDMPTIRAIVQQAATEGNTFESILKGIVDSPAFRMRQLPSAPAVGTKQASVALPPPLADLPRSNLVSKR